MNSIIKQLDERIRELEEDKESNSIIENELLTYLLKWKAREEQIEKIIDEEYKDFLTTQHKFPYIGNVNLFYKILKQKLSEDFK